MRAGVGVRKRRPARRFFFGDFFGGPVEFFLSGRRSTLTFSLAPFVFFLFPSGINLFSSRVSTTSAGRLRKPRPLFGKARCSPSRLLRQRPAATARRRGGRTRQCRRRPIASSRPARTHRQRRHRPRRRWRQRRQRQRQPQPPPSSPPTAASSSSHSSWASSAPPSPSLSFR